MRRYHCWVRDLLPCRSETITETFLHAKRTGYTVQTDNVADADNCTGNCPAAARITTGSKGMWTRVWAQSRSRHFDEYIHKISNCLQCPDDGFRWVFSTYCSSPVCPSAPNKLRHPTSVFTTRRLDTGFPAQEYYTSNDDELSDDDDEEWRMEFYQDMDDARVDAEEPSAEELGPWGLWSKSLPLIKARADDLAANEGAFNVPTGDLFLNAPSWPAVHSIRTWCFAGTRRPSGSNAAF